MCKCFGYAMFVLCCKSFFYSLKDFKKFADAGEVVAVASLEIRGRVRDERICSGYKGRNPMENKEKRKTFCLHPIFIECNSTLRFSFHNFHGSYHLLWI